MDSIGNQLRFVSRMDLFSPLDLSERRIVADRVSSDWFAKDRKINCIPLLVFDSPLRSLDRCRLNNKGK